VEIGGEYFRREQHLHRLPRPRNDLAGPWLHRVLRQVRARNAFHDVPRLFTGRNRKLHIVERWQAGLGA
jgi:hypothetical protein